MVACQYHAKQLEVTSRKQHDEESRGRAPWYERGSFHTCARLASVSQPRDQLPHPTACSYTPSRADGGRVSSARVKSNNEEVKERFGRCGISWGRFRGEWVTCTNIEGLETVVSPPIIAPHFPTRSNLQQPKSLFLTTKTIPLSRVSTNQCFDYLQP